MKTQFGYKKGIYMAKIKYNQYITKDEIPNIIKEKYPNLKCPKCHHNTLYGGCLETQFDERKEKDVILSFVIFCKDCGACLNKWDNTNRNYFIGRRGN